MEEETVLPVEVEETVVPARQTRRTAKTTEAVDPDAIPAQKLPAMEAGAFVNWSPDELAEIYAAFPTKRKAQDYIANTTLEMLNNSTEFFGQADPRAVAAGDAEILKYLNLSIGQQGRGMRNAEQIMRYFTNLKQFGDPGVPAETDALFSGALEGGGALYGGLKGARYGFQIGSIPNPYVAITAPVGAVTGFLTGSLIGGVLGDAAGDLAFDQIEANRPLTPGTEGALRAYQSSGTAIPFILNPALGPTTRISQAYLIRNLPKKSFMGPITAEDMANPYISRYLKGKSYKPIEAMAWAEDLLISGGKAWQKAGKLQKTGIIAAESAAVPATYGAVSMAQEAYGPRSEGATITGELLGGLAPNLSILKHLPDFGIAAKKYVNSKMETYRQTKEETGTGTFDVFGRRARAEAGEIQKILAYMEESGEDPTAVLKFMEETFLDENGKLKPEFIVTDPKTKKGVTAKTFSSQFIDSPALASLDAQVMKNMGDLDAVRESSFGRSMTMQRALVEELRGTGDPNLIRVAGQIQQSRIELLMSMRTNQAVEQAVLAVKQVYPNGGPEAAEVLGKNLADLMNKQREVFRNIEEQTWAQVDGTTAITKFQKTDPNDPKAAPTFSDVPNVVDAWDAILKEKGVSFAQFRDLMDDKDLVKINDTIEFFKIRLGLKRDTPNALAPTPKPVQNYFDALEEAAGEDWLDTFKDTINKTNFARDSDGRVLPNQKNIDLIVSLIEDQRPNPLLKNWETATGKLTNRLDVYGNPYSDEALRIEREALEGTTERVNGPNEEAVETAVAQLNVQNNVYRREKGTRENIGFRDADLEEAKNVVISNIKKAADDVEIDELVDEFSNLYGMDDIPISESRFLNLPISEAAMNLVAQHAEVAKLRLAPPTFTETAVAGSTEDALQALQDAQLGLRQLGEVGNLRVKALEARRLYLQDRLKRETAESSGSEASSLPPGPVARMLSLQKKALVARRRALNSTENIQYQPKEPLSANELIGLRKSLRQMANKFNAPNGNSDFARLVNEMRHAALEDLMSYEGTGAAYLNAIDASKAFGDYFKRTFGSDILQRDARGRLIVNPDSGLNTLFSGNADTVRTRLNSIERLGEELAETATKFGANPEDVSKITTNLGTQEELLHDAFTNLLQRATSASEETFKLTEAEQVTRQLQRIRDWAKTNSRIVSFFPELQEQISNLTNPQAFLASIDKSVKAMKGTLRSSAAFAASQKGVESPTIIIDKIYKSEDPSRQLRQLASNLASMPNEEMARKASAEMGRVFPEGGVFTPEEATEGLQRAVMDYAFQSARIGDIKGGLGNFDASTLYRVLFQKIPKADSDSMTLANFLEARGAINETQKKTMKSALERMVAMQAQSAATGADMDGFNVPAILDLYTRIAGARLGQMAGGILPGGRSAGLVEESAGSKYAQQITQEIPFLMEQDAFQRIMLNPEKLMLAMRTPRNENEKQGIIRTLMRFLATPVKAIASGAVGSPTGVVVRRGPAAIIEEITSEETEPSPETDDTIPTAGQRRRPRVGRRPEPKPPEKTNEEVEEALRRAREFLDSRPKPPRVTGPRTHFRQQSSLQPSGIGALPLPAGTAAPSGVQTASVDSAGSGIGSIDINKARQLFPNDITFAARGGEMRSGIGGLFR